MKGGIQVNAQKARGQLGVFYPIITNLEFGCAQKLFLSWHSAASPSPAVGTLILSCFARGRTWGSCPCKKKRWILSSLPRHIQILPVFFGFLQCISPDLSRFRTFRMIICSRRNNIVHFYCVFYLKSRNVSLLSRVMSTNFHFLSVLCQYTEMHCGCELCWHDYVCLNRIFSGTSSQNLKQQRASFYLRCVAFDKPNVRSLICTF